MYLTIECERPLGSRVGDGESEGFDAPDEAGGPGFLGGERGAPEGEDLRALVDALETFLGFGNGFDGGDPEFFDERRVQRDADALPAIFHAQNRAGQRAAEAKIFLAGGGFEETVRLGGGKEIDDGFDADGHRVFQRFLELQADLAGDFATVGRGAE